MKKKVIFGTALFIIVGLFMFTFANPNDKVSDEKSSKQNVQEVSTEETSNEEQKSVEPKKEETQNNSSTTRRVVRRNTTNNQAPAVIQPATEAVNNDDEAAKKALEEQAKKDAEEKAKKEAEDLAKYKEAAKEELKNYNKDVDYSDNNKVAVADIKKDGYDAIDDAKTKAEVDKALEDAKNLIDALDTVAPVITVAENEEVYQKPGKATLDNYTVTDNVSAKDKIAVTIKIVKDNKKLNEVDYNVLGTYTITYTATDEAGNSATATRTIKVNEVKAVSLVLKAGNEDVTNVTDTYIAGTSAKDIDVYLKNNDGSLKRIHAFSCVGFYPFIKCTDGYFVNGTINTDHAFNGTKTLTYSYKGVKSVTYSYKVIPQKVVSLEVIANKTSYIQGEKFDITVNATWNTGKVEKNVKYTTKANTNTVGNGQKAVISYKDADATYTYDVIGRVVTKLQVTNNKSSYIQGQDFDLTVNAIWNDGKVEKNVKYTTNNNTNTIGNNQEGKVTYNGVDESFSFNVEARRVTKLEVVTNKTNYIQGQAFDIKVNATWNDGKVEKNVAYTTNSNTNNIGRNQTATVSYEGASATFKFNVEARKVTKLEVITNKTVYTKGEDFDITVNATWNDGKVEKNVAYTTTANTKTVGKDQTATIYYEGKSATFKFDVIANISLRVTSTFTDYIKGEKIDNITVYAKDLSTGKETVVTNYTISGDTSKVGYGQTATISYDGATTTYTYNVKYELHLIKHGYYYYLEFIDNINIASIVYYDKKGNNSTIYQANSYYYNNKVGNKYYLDNSEYGELHSMNGKDADQKLVITLSNGTQYTYTKVEVTNK